jgi:putative transposase
MTINNDLIDQLLADYQNPQDVLGENGLLKQLTKAVLERALQAELTHHLGYDKHSSSGNNFGNSRNGRSKKTLKGEFGNLPVEVPRDRNSSFEPKIIPKGQTRFDGFDGKVLSLYARGITTRQIQQHLEEIYQVEVSPSLISSVTDAISDEVKAWHSRPLDSV